jgi:hypothetical protein
MILLRIHSQSFAQVDNQLWPYPSGEPRSDCGVRVHVCDWRPGLGLPGGPGGGPSVGQQFLEPVLRVT